jgi:hypothetical protein
MIWPIAFNVGMIDLSDVDNISNSYFLTAAVITVGYDLAFQCFLIVIILRIIIILLK